MLTFKVELKSGSSVYEQVIYAVKKAIISGSLRPGDKFPSVRVLSQELKINPNTAHKIVAALIDQGLLEVRPGIGTKVAEVPPPDSRQRRDLLGKELERLVVEAKKLSLDLDEVILALEEHWTQLSSTSTDVHDESEHPRRSKK